MTINELVTESHNTAVDKGWWRESHLKGVCDGEEKAEQGRPGMAA